MEEEILKDLSINIIKWYEWKENTQILYIGQNEGIAKYLQKRDEVEQVSSFNEITNMQKYDYIIIDTEEINIFDIQKLKENIKKDSIILFLLDNKYGVTNFITYNYQAQISTLEEEKKYVNIEKIQQYLRSSDFFINKYMVYPNKNRADMVIREDFNEISDKLDKYFYDYDNEKVVLCDEARLMKNILEYDKELFKKIANSYIIEASPSEIQNDIKYVSFNNYRKNQYRLITKIKNDIVEKQEENEEAKIHIKEIANSLQELEKYEFKILDKYENNKLYSKLIKNRLTLDIDLANHSEDTEYIIDKIFKIRDVLIKHSMPYEDIAKKEEILIYGMEGEDKLKELHFLEYAFYDMVPKNCFYIDGEFYFFDQEWMEKYLPVEFIMYRAIINSYDLVRKINIDIFLEKLEIIQYKKLFEQIDKKIREKVTDYNRLNLCQKTYNKMYEIIYEHKVLKREKKKQDVLIQEYINNNKKQDEYIKYLEDENTKMKEKLENSKLLNKFFKK